MTHPHASSLDRRQFLAAAGSAAAASGIVGAGPLLAAQPETASPRGQAESCIFLWLGGGAAHLDTFDPKRRSTGRKDPGSYYDPIDTAAAGVQVCEHLPRIARLLDDVTLVRTLHHDVIDEHAAAVNRLHTGRPTSGTIVYPSIGSVVAHEMGPADGAPPYVVIGYPNLTRGPGFLGARHSYVYLTDTKLGPPGLRRPHGVDEARQARRLALLDTVREEQLGRLGSDPAVRDYAAASQAGFRLAGPDFMQAFDLASESPQRRADYGDEFGQRCLLARRLVERGVRFVEVSFNLNFINGTGWDTHNEGQLNQHVLIEQLDQALAALIDDLRRVGRLDQTLVVVATEFGRPAEFDGGGGRGHYSKAFSGVLAGGGLRHRGAIGVTDELGKVILERPVSIPDFHATIYAGLGIDPAGELYDGERPVPITDQGRALAELFA